MPSFTFAWIHVSIQIHNYLENTVLEFFLMFLVLSLGIKVSLSNPSKTDFSPYLQRIVGGGSHLPHFSGPLTDD
jgi:hypothetical protein